MNFSAVAHDLRNPLNVMLGHMQLLSVEPLSETARRRLSVVEAQVRRMIRLLDACGEEGSGARIAPVDLTALIANVVSELDITLAEMGIEITASIDGTLPLLAGDHDALHRVMVNVLMNAADAINGTGRIDIGASATEGCYAESGGVRIEITDTGTGIPCELLPRVFDDGFTTRAGDRSRGLGLSICREIVDMHGGDIRISSVPGQGTTVRVSLPVRSAVRGGSALPPADHTR